MPEIPIVTPIFLKRILLSIVSKNDRSKRVKPHILILSKDSKQYLMSLLIMLFLYNGVLRRLTGRFHLRHEILPSIFYLCFNNKEHIDGNENI